MSGIGESGSFRRMIEKDRVRETMESEYRGLMDEIRMGRVVSFRDAIRGVISDEARYVEAESTLRLYRGDATKIDTFSLDRADWRALFGTGIYLTNNRRIAGDYMTKGAKVLFRFGGRSGRVKKQDVIDAYIRMRIAPYLDDRGREVAGLAGWSRYQNTGLEWDKGWKLRMRSARAIWKRMERTHEVRVNVDGEAVIREKSKRGSVTAYDVPMTWIDRCLHADAEVPKNVLEALYDVLREVGDRKTGDAMLAFNDQCEKWGICDPEGEFEILPGERPTFRTIFTSITADSPMRHDEHGMTLFRKAMKSLGYKGIEYVGGVTMGGGGKHRAFVFWDEQGLKKFRVQTESVPVAREKGQG